MTACAALLQALLEGPGHGLGLLARVAERSGGRWRIREGSAYPALRRLEALGFVSSSREPPPPGVGGRPKILYALTPSGEVQALRESLEVLALLGFDVPARPDPSELEALRALVASVRRP